MSNARSSIVTVLCVVAFFMAAGASAAPRAGGLDAQAGGDGSARDPTPKELLATVCKAHPNEPACQPSADLSEDESWLVLRSACRGYRRDENAAVQDSAAEAKRACADYYLRQAGVLIHDFDLGTWTAEWESKSYPLKIDVAGIPTMRLRPAQAKPLKIVVTNISPLAYSAAPGTPKEDDLAVVSDLKSLLALAGTGVQGLVRSLAFSAAAGVPDSVPQPATEQESGKDTHFFNMMKGPKGAQAPPPPDPCSVDVPAVRPLAEALRLRVEQLVRLNGALRGLDMQLALLEARKARFIRAAQMAEDGKTVTPADLFDDVPELGAPYKTLDDIALHLDEGTAALVACQPMLGAYATLLGAPPKRGVVVPFADAVLAAQGCPEFRDTIRRNAQALRMLASTVSCEPALKGELELQGAIMKPFLARLSDVKEAESSLWKAVDKARSSRKEVFAGAATLQREIDSARLHTWNGVLIRELVVTRQNPELRWSKVQSHSIVIKADSPYVKELTLSRGAEEKREYKLESATGQILGYGIGLVYTPLYESTFTAATVPGSTTKVIAETGRETRAGDLAAFVSYRFLEHRPAPRRYLQPTLDFGVGLTSGRPAFFLGVGGELFRAARIGFGWAPQRVSVLAPGQTVNQTIVTSNDDIKTITRFDTDHYYVSVSFALDSLSLFNKP